MSRARAACCLGPPSILRANSEPRNGVMPEVLRFDHWFGKTTVVHSLNAEVCLATSASARIDDVDCKDTKVDGIKCMSVRCTTIQATHNLEPGKLLFDATAQQAKFEPSDFIRRGIMPEFAQSSGFTHISNDYLCVFIEARPAAYNIYLHWDFSFSSPVPLGGPNCLDIILRKPTAFFGIDSQRKFYSLYWAVAFKDPNISDLIHVNIIGPKESLPKELPAVSMNLVFRLYRRST